MADFETLQKMDIEVVHRKTRITLVRLQDILDKNFDNIDPTRAHGFIKILERELQLDLSDWIKEYDDYKKLNTQKDLATSTQDISSENNNIETIDKAEDTQSSFNQKKQVDVSPKPQRHDTSIKIDMPNYKASYKIIILAVCVVLLFIILGIYFISNTNTPQKQTIEKSDAKKDVVEKNIGETYPTISLYEALNDKEPGIKQHTDSNQTEHKNMESSQNLESTDNSLMEQKIDIAKNEETKQNKLTIIPKNEVWFAWVDTITKKRGEKYTKQKPVEIIIENPTVFHFGYAVLSIEVDGQTFEYNQMGVTYMLYDKQQGIKIITQKEYRALGGK